MPAASDEPQLTSVQGQREFDTRVAKRTRLVAFRLGYILVIGIGVLRSNKHGEDSLSRFDAFIANVAASAVNSLLQCIASKQAKTNGLQSF